MDKEILSFPFNSKLVDGKHDRVWDANDFARDRQVFIGNGIYPNPSDNLKVVSLYNNMRLTLKGGAAWIEGHSYVQGRIRNGVVEGVDLEFDIAPNDTGTIRHDMIVLDCSLIRRNIVPVYVEGSTELIRNDDIHQLMLARFPVNPGATSIPQQTIDDTRLNKDLCGIMYAMVDNVDTTDIYNQYQTYLDEQIASWDTRKEEQKTAWQAQMTAQQSASDAQLAQQKVDFEAWFAKINVDIQIIATFNFDNLAALPFTEKLMSWPTGRQLETITVSGSTAIVAERELDFSTMITTERVYNSSGEVVRTATMEKLFLPDGSIKDVITL